MLHPQEKVHAPEQKFRPCICLWPLLLYENPLSSTVADLSFLAEKLNRLLPKDIAVYRIVPVRPEAHARFDATSRTYKYYITTRKDPFNYDLVYRMSGQLDFEAMNEACKVLFDYIDFTSFSKLHTDVKTNNCRIYKAGWEQEGDVWVFTVQADRFLRNMVRDDPVNGNIFRK